MTEPLIQEVDMSITKYYPFSNGTEFMWWQGHNCDKCVKASRYNRQTDTYTKYRCAIQRDIEMASIGDGTTSKRVYDICQEADCRYRQTGRKQYSRKPKHDNHPNLFE